MNFTMPFIRQLLMGRWHAEPPFYVGSLGIKLCRVHIYDGHVWHTLILIIYKTHMGVDLNSFIRDPSFSPKKLYTFAKLRLPAFYLSPKYVVFMCAMYVVLCSRQWLLLYWQTQNRNFTVCQHVSST